MDTDLSQYAARQAPERKIFTGRYARIEPLDPDTHSAQLYAASSVDDAAERFRYLYEYPPADSASFENWVAEAARSNDPLFFAVIDQATGRVGGRQTLMRIDEKNGSIEIGNIYWGPAISRTAVTTEALYLFMAYVFDELGYRRFEWKCNNNNEPSKRAALRFGFKHEGLFRQHLIVKGLNRDTAWFSIIDSEWPQLKSAYEQWFDVDNFDEKGQQRAKLADLIAQSRN